MLDVCYTERKEKAIKYMMAPVITRLPGRPKSMFFKMLKRVINETIKVAGQTHLNNYNTTVTRPRGQGPASIQHRQIYNSNNNNY